MPTNDFLPFAGDPAANVMTQTDYIAAGYTPRTLGFSKGTALSPELNKVWRQASLIAHMISQFSVDHANANMLDDGTPAGLTALETAFATAVHNVAVAATPTGFLPLGGGTLTGRLIMNADVFEMNAPTNSDGQLQMTRGQGHAQSIGGYTASSPRWDFVIADAEPEHGANSGTNLYIASFSDAGAYLDTPLSINRATGVVNFSHIPTVNGAAMAYVPLAGNVTMSGPLGIGGLGMSFAGLGGGFWAQHKVAFGWDGSFMEMAVDGVDVGQIATVAWTEAVAGAYLPLGGGTLSGALTVNSAVTISGTLFNRGAVIFGNLADFANVYDGSQYRFRQWAGSWYDAWDGKTGNRVWSGTDGTNGYWVMTLDGTGSLWVRNSSRVDGGRLLSQSGVYPPSVTAYWYGANPVAVGFWADVSGMWLGNMDGNGGPASAHFGIANSGYATFYNGLSVNAGLWVGQGAAFNADMSVAGTLYANGNASVAGTLYAQGNFSSAGSSYLHATSVTGDLGVSGNAGIGASMTVGGNFTCNNTVSGATVSSTGYMWANDRIIANSGYPGIVSWNTVAGAAGVRFCDGSGMHWGQTTGTGNSPSPLMTLGWDGTLSALHINAPSDDSIKHNIQPVEPFDSLAALRAIENVQFDWDLDEKHTPFGVLAEQVKQHLPDVVSRVREIDGINLLAMLVHTIRAIQQLADKVEANV